MIENVKAASRWLTENVDLTIDFQYITNNIHIMANSSPVRIVISSGCGVVNGRFTKDPYIWNCGEEAYDLADEYPHGAESSLADCGRKVALEWEAIRNAVFEHNEKIKRTMEFKIH